MKKHNDSSFVSPNGSNNVIWDEAEFHHIIPHSDGGQTVIDNGALMHIICHPKSRSDVDEFRLWWESKHVSIESEQRRTRENKSSELPPDGTLLKRTYKNVEYTGIIESGKIFIENDENPPYDSLSSAAVTLTGTSLNGWTWWLIKLPDEDEFIMADEWRERNTQ